MSIISIIGSGHMAAAIGGRTAKAGHTVFAITIRNGKLTKIREYIDTQAMARASARDPGPRP